LYLPKASLSHPVPENSEKDRACKGKKRIYGELENNKHVGVVASEKYREPAYIMRKKVIYGCYG
jgi:hypothetical protein